MNKEILEAVKSLTNCVGILLNNASNYSQGLVDEYEVLCRKITQAEVALQQPKNNG